MQSRKTEALRDVSSLLRDMRKRGGYSIEVTEDIKVVMALGIHLYPSRTEKLSPITPMVLRKSGRVGSRRFD